MLFDHIGILYLNYNEFFRIIGRFSFIYYAFLMAESYFHLREKPDRLRFHVLKLLILSLITEITYDLCFFHKWLEFSLQNALFTLLSGFLTLIGCGWWCKKQRGRKIAAAAGCAVLTAAGMAATYFLRTDYQTAGVLVIVLFCFYLCHADKWKLPVKLAALLGIYVLFIIFFNWEIGNYRGWRIIVYYLRAYWVPWYIPVFCTLAFYNRKPGYRSKWFDRFYSLFYPLQFIVFILISKLISR